jgi:hypothetical protein
MAHFQCVEFVSVTCRRIVVVSDNWLSTSPGRVREPFLCVGTIDFALFRFKAIEEYISLTNLRPFHSLINAIMQSVRGTWRRTTWNQGTRSCLHITARSHGTKSEMK